MKSPQIKYKYLKKKKYILKYSTCVKILSCFPPLFWYNRINSITSRVFSKLLYRKAFGTIMCQLVCVCVSEVYSHVCVSGVYSQYVCIWSVVSMCVFGVYSQYVCMWSVQSVCVCI